VTEDSLESQATRRDVSKEPKEGSGHDFAAATTGTTEHNGFDMDNSSVVTEDTNDDMRPSKMLGSKKLGRAFTGFANRLKQTHSHSLGDGILPAPPTGGKQNVTPKDDAILHENLEKLLRNKVKQSPTVGSTGIQSEEQTIPIPEGLDHGSSCEVVPAQHIKPFVEANGKSEAHNGIKIFAYAKGDKNTLSSVDFLRKNIESVESFAVVLERLCLVFEIPLASVAIYHDPTGRAIAFNAQGALYFNVRYYHSLHYTKNLHTRQPCYCYWFVVVCHELAHNMEGPHNQTHAFYTESYTGFYMPKLLSLLSRVEE